MNKKTKIERSSIIAREKNSPLGGHELTIDCMKKRAMTGTYGAKHKRLTLCATRIIIFQREKLNYLIVCITQGTFFVQHVCLLFVIWKMDVMKHHK